METNDVHQSEKPWQNKNIWKRGLLMLLFGFIAGLGRFIISLIAIFQFLSLLLSEKPNEPLVKFGQSLTIYLYQINQFLTVNAEEYPFPFADWPASSDEVVADVVTSQQQETSPTTATAAAKTAVTPAPEPKAEAVAPDSTEAEATTAEKPTTPVRKKATTAQDDVVSSETPAEKKVAKKSTTETDNA